MICPRCGAENRPDRRFCRSCGAALGAVCAACGAANEPGDRFCGACGTVLGGAREAEPRGTAAAAEPGPGASPTTERRLVSVLFADLVGSTSMAEGADVEAVRELLSAYYDAARETVNRYGGTVEKFIGDAVMAVWGSPVAHEDDAERAVRAALDLLDAAGRLPRPGGGRLEARAAVLTGEAAVALDAAGQGMVAGDLVNAASRLQSAAPPGAVLVGEATVRSSEAAIAYEPAGEQVLKGRTTPIPAWRALRVVAGRRGLGRATRLEAPFVGREDELRMLKEVLHQTARERRPRLVSITGIAGIGKTRLAWELEKYVDGLVETVYWHQGRSPAYGDGLAFWALAEMVRRRARIAETDEPALARERLASMAAEYVPDPDERARVEPRLAALLGLEPAPPGGAEELTGAWRTLFERVADRGPTVLVFEDLHWADPGLLDFIEGLLTSARTRPILVLALARPELMVARPTWGAVVRNHLRLDLAPLEPAAMEMLLLGMAPGIPPEAMQIIRDRSEGVPLYAVETVRMLLDQGRLTESDGRFRLVGDLRSLAVPESMQSLLGSRLDALDEQTRDLIGHGAVLGISFTVEALASVSGRPADDVRASLDALVSRELLVLDDDPASPERGQYRFLQGILREVAYARLSRRERVARHLAAAGFFDATGTDELAGVVATHLLAAVRDAPEDAEREPIAMRARMALEAAAARSRSIGAHASAAGYLSEAVELTVDDDERLRLREARLPDLSLGRDLAEAEREARAIADLARARGDHRLLARAAFALAEVLINAGRPADAVSEVGAIRNELGEVAIEDPDGIRLSAELARAHLMAGQPDLGGALIEDTLPRAERLGLRDAIAELLPSKGWALSTQGRPIEAMAVLRGSLVLAERDGLVRAEMRSRMNLTAWAVWEDPSEAFAVASEGLDRGLARGYGTWALALAGNACDTAFNLGMWDWIGETVRRLALDESETPWDLGPVSSLSAVEAYRGHEATTTALLAHLREVIGPLQDPQLKMTLAAAAAECAHARGDLETASREARQALDLGDAAGLGDAPQFGIIALATRDLAAARLAAERPRGGLVRDALLDAFGGGSDVLAGDRGGLAVMDRAIAQLEAASVRFLAAQLLRLRATLAPDDAGARAAAERAAAIFGDLGAVTMLRGLEALLPATASPPSAATSQATSRPQ